MIAESKQTHQPVVLIVDDQEWSSRSLESVLAIDGYHVIRARSAAQAMDTAAAHNPDLLVISRRLPNGDGIALCRTVRNDPRFGAGVPILMTTPEAPTRKQRLAALRAGAWEFFSYPLDPADLLLRLQSYLQRPHAIRTPPAHPG